RQHDVADPALTQDEVEICRAERALAGLVDDALALERRELGDDLPTGLAAHQHAATRADVTDAGLPCGAVLKHTRAPALVRRQIGKVGSVPLAGVQNPEPLLAKKREHLADRFDTGPTHR